jgi:hypothetical protein
MPFKMTQAPGTLYVWSWRWILSGPRADCKQSLSIPRFAVPCPNFFALCKPEFRPCAPPLEFFLLLCTPEKSYIGSCVIQKSALITSIREKKTSSLKNLWKFLLDLRATIQWNSQWMQKPMKICCARSLCKSAYKHKRSEKGGNFVCTSSAWIRRDSPQKLKNKQHKQHKQQQNCSKTLAR